MFFSTLCRFICTLLADNYENISKNELFNFLVQKKTDPQTTISFLSYFFRVYFCGKIV